MADASWFFSTRIPPALASGWCPRGSTEPAPNGSGDAAALALVPAFVADAKAGRMLDGSCARYSLSEPLDHARRIALRVRDEAALAAQQREEARLAVERESRRSEEERRAAAAALAADTSFRLAELSADISDIRASIGYYLAPKGAPLVQRCRELVLAIMSRDVQAGDMRHDRLYSLLQRQCPACVERCATSGEVSINTTKFRRMRAAALRDLYIFLLMLP